MIEAICVILVLFVLLKLVLPITPQAGTAITGALVATNATFGLGNASYTVRLGTNQVTPGSITGWTDATFGGYAAITTGPGFTAGNNTLTGGPTLTLGPPAGGFTWTCNGTGNMSQTINSIRIDITSNGTPLAVQNLEKPQTVGQNGDQVVVGPLQIIVIPITPA